MKKQTQKFKTEVQQLLDLVIHSLYSKKEIFLRELISNASDALDRRHFETLTDPSLATEEQEDRIKIIPDRNERTLSISDNGIGMNREELINNIGTIASSGTRRFLEQLSTSNRDKSELIGQFGVGFYSAFMVADKVTVITRRAGNSAPALKWSSSGTGTFSIEENPEETAPGTSVILHMREDFDEFLQPEVIRRIVKAYSDYIAYPIILETAEDSEQQSVINSRTALWKQPREKVTDEQYNEFYRHITHDHADPLSRLHIAAEGTLEFRALLFVPPRANIDLFRPDSSAGVQLYVHNVFITEECRELIPDYLRFIRGVVDSSDLPLNVSREMLQNDRTVRLIRKNLTTKLLGHFAELLQNNRECYEKMWNEFGSILKEGCQPGEAMEKLTGLLLFKSINAASDQWLSLEQYLANMQENQKHIYYLSTDNKENIKNSPHLEVFKQKRIDVLLMTDPVDEFMLMHLHEFNGHTLKAIDQENLELPQTGSDVNKNQLPNHDNEKEVEKETTDLLRKLEEILKENVSAVRISPRLTDSACCLVADANAMPPALEKLMQRMNQPVPEQKRILELNQEHPLFNILETQFKKNPRSDDIRDIAWLLYNQALLANGGNIGDVSNFNRLVCEMTRKAFSDDKQKNQH